MELKRAEAVSNNADQSTAVSDLSLDIMAFLSLHLERSISSEKHLVT